MVLMACVKKTRTVRIPHSRMKSLLIIGCLILLSGCVVKPKALTSKEQQGIVEKDRKVLFDEIEPITGPITLEEAIARGLKHNLEHRLMLMEEALRTHQTDMSIVDMLPKLAANAGWNTRSNDYLTLDKSPGATPDKSYDRTRRTADLTMTWNILDFGISYYQAKQSADQAMIAEERRRKVINRVIQEVRTAYWRSATAEPLSKRLTPLLVEARKSLDDARAIESRRLSPPLDILVYQKGLVEVIRDLESLERDLAVAKAELASLMGLPPGTSYTLAHIPDENLDVPNFSLSLDEMEDLTLFNRPELREEAYQRRITAAETKKALLRFLPGISFTGSLNYDSNSYLVNSDWGEAGARVTWNLLNLVTAPTAMRVAEAQREVGDSRRLALSMAALTQVHIGYQNYLRTKNIYEQAQLLGNIEQRIFTHVENASRMQTPLQRIRAELSAIFADIGRYRAYADMQGAVANLYVSIGLDLLPESVEGHDLNSLRAAIAKVLADWNEGVVHVVQPVE